jgi:hypothetical protein
LRDSFSLKTLKKEHFGEQYQLKISNKGADLENCDNREIISTREARLM